MRQIFFIGVVDSFPHPFHVWTDPDGQTVGVVEMNGECDAEKVISDLEAKGILWMPNHFGSEKIKPEHAQALKKHGVLPSDTTSDAMNKVYADAGFPPLKPKRF